MPIENTVRLLLSAAGLTVVSSDTALRSAAIEIRITGKALPAKYGSIMDSFTAYAEVNLQGILHFESSGTPAIVRSFRGFEFSNFVREGSYRSPSDAPFDRALLQSELWRILAGVIEQHYGIQPVVSYWLEALRSPELVSTDDAVESLGTLGDAAATPLVARLQFGRDVQAISALRKIGTPAVTRLIEALAAQDPHQRAGAADALGWFVQDPRVFESIKTAVSDKEILVQEQAIDTIRMYGPKSLPVLLSALQDREVRVRKAAAKALRDIDDPAAVGTRTSALQLDSSVRDEAKKALLHRIDNTRSVPVLITALRSHDSDVRYQAARVLKELTNQDFREDTAAWQQWWDAQAKETTAK